jgi:hypothetical protein
MSLIVAPYIAHCVAEKYDCSVYRPHSYRSIISASTHQPHLRSLHSNARTPRASIPLRRQNLIIVRAQLLPILGPGIKVIFDCNRSPNPLALPHAPELLERRRPINGRLVGARRLQDIIGAAVRGDGALLLSSRRRVVAAVRLDDVVLDEWVAGPSVEGDVAVDAAGVPGSGVGDDALTAGVPALSGDEVADVGPLDVVLFEC